MGCANESNLLCYGITRLPYVVSTVEDLKLSSTSGERVNTPMTAAKFLHLNFLEIYLDGDLSPGYDYLSLVSFLNASPALETFIFRVDQDEMLFDSIIGGALHMRQMPNTSTIA
uniref:At1g61320/AtMIF1 LRR domain-containing protein n=1 Tax=Hordeum vulgare subsp. vulgare TaxID=112509 RepID=A0A8I6YP50_HORVV